MVRVVQEGGIRIYVYAEGGHKHHLPHRPVYWPGAACAIDLDYGRVIAGLEPPDLALQLFRRSLPNLKRFWALLNPER